MTIERSLSTGTWRDPSATPEARVSDLLAQMTTAEKVAQLYGVWVGVDAASGEVAPRQQDLAIPAVSWDELIQDGLGQLTRVYGTSPVTPAEGARAVARSQRQIVAAGRHGIPALVHEECLTGLAAWQATVYPSPLCWGATFDPDLVERMARPDRRHHAPARHPPGARSGPGCGAGLAVGAVRGDHRRGPLPGRVDRQRLCPRPGVRWAWWRR